MTIYYIDGEQFFCDSTDREFLSGDKITIYGIEFFIESSYYNDGIFHHYCKLGFEVDNTNQLTFIEESAKVTQKAWESIKPHVLPDNYHLVKTNYKIPPEMQKIFDKIKKVETTMMNAYTKQRLKQLDTIHSEYEKTDKKMTFRNFCNKKGL